MYEEKKIEIKNKKYRVEILDYFDEWDYEHKLEVKIKELQKVLFLNLYLTVDSFCCKMIDPNIIFTEVENKLSITKD